MNRSRQSYPTVKRVALLASTLGTIALCGTGAAQAQTPVNENPSQAGRVGTHTQDTTPDTSSQDRRMVPRAQDTMPQSDQDRRMVPRAQDTTPQSDQDRRMMARTPDTTPPNPDKAGRIMLNARGGVAIGMANANQDLRYMGTLGIDFGVAVTSDRNAYVILTPQVDLRANFYNVMIPIGFQYDIRLFRGLYLYPRASIGYSAIINNPSVNVGSLRVSATDVTHGGVAISELGLKYIINGRFNLGVEPLSVPVFFNGNGYAAWYRMMAFVGGNF